MISSLTRKEHKLETDKDAKFQRLEEEVAAAGIVLSTFLPVFRKELLATPDSDRALNNFLRFIAAGFSSSLLRNFADHPVLLSVALTLFGHSQYLADILVRNPELFYWLTATNALTEARSKEEYRDEAFSVMAPFDRTDKKFDALKRFQRREFLKISTRDILKEADLATVTAELSWLADSLVDAAVSVGCDELIRHVGSEMAST
jgi:[glutamine synthetase] adenylyltransferase / [glutamine synthetase]-adenylyl-L-tyrosine phosphorylase